MHGRKNLKNVEDNNVTNILLMNKENCALKLVDEIILYCDARSKKHQITFPNYSNKRNLKYVSYIYDMLLTTEHFLISATCSSKFHVGHYITSHIIKNSSLTI